MMNPQEAFKVLEVSEDISDDALKVKYKELAKKYHPDVFKEDPEKFKKINEAYQLIQDFRKNPEKYQQRPSVQQQGFWNNVVDLGDIFFNNDFFRQDGVEQPFRAPPINLSLTLSFHESIKGCTKEVTYSRFLKCNPCNGVGTKTIANDCKKCDGFGRVTQNNRGMIFQTACADCKGKGVKKNKCETCKGKRVVDEKRTGNVNIPAGLQNGHTIRLAGEGHYIGKSFMHDTYADVSLKLNIESYKDMVLKNVDVCSTINISLLEALEGVNKQVETVYGNKDIAIPAKSRHSDQVKIANCGVTGTGGCHVVTLNVEYPSDISNIIGVLKDGISNKL